MGQMNNRKYLLLVALIIVSGLIGGAVSNWIFMARTAITRETLSDKDILNAFEVQNTPLQELITAKVIKAEEFRLVDKEGRTYAVLGKPDDDKYPGLWLYDGQSKVSVGLYAGEFWSGLCLYDKQGDPYINLDLALGNPYLTLRRKKNQSVKFTLSPDGTPILQLTTGEGKTRTIPLDSEWRTPSSQAATLLDLSRAYTKEVEVIELTSKTIDRISGSAVYLWKLTLRNNSDRTAEGLATIAFKDSQGFVIHRSLATTFTLRPGEQKTFSDKTIVMIGAEKVFKLDAEIKMD
jgi:hypothetical protein